MHGSAVCCIVTNSFTDLHPLPHEAELGSEACGTRSIAHVVLDTKRCRLYN